MQLIYGINPVREVLRQSGERIKEIIVATGKTGSAIQGILSTASGKNISIVFKDRSYLENLTGCNSHQGVVALCGAFAYADIDEVIDNRTGARNTILILDGITDPQNLGAIIRTAHCLGVNGVIIPEDRAVSVTATVIKASAGAAYLIPLAREVNLSRAIGYLKERGFWIYGADADSGRQVDEITDDGPLGLVMGSEGRGLRPLIRKKCDFLLSIPMLGNIGSLNVSVAAGIILYEILRKQGRRK
ncbi:MAG: 23S rRNA (guanosine(2251)-2'-O)-methyltransferase RlmB [Syntrophales bacterium LBB04]|nr:23S rRNA (guanosine(2251)-2'-O)-methyltransferase RlmB [Syntrophales bacterium LBB04]